MEEVKATVGVDNPIAWLGQSNWTLELRKQVGTSQEPRAVCTSIPPSKILDAPSRMSKPVNGSNAGVLGLRKQHIKMNEEKKPLPT